MAYIRTVKTASAARAVQIVHSSRKGSRDIEHIGSAHDDVELVLLKTVAGQRLAAGQGELDLGLDVPPEAGGPLPITATRMGHLWDALSLAYDVLGFNRAAGGDEVFRHLVLARIIEPTSKLDSLRVLVLTGNTITHPCGNRAFGRRPGGRRIAVTRKEDQRAPAREWLPFSWVRGRTVGGRAAASTAGGST